MSRRRKRGRPATGHDPILGVRVPAKIIREIDRLAEAFKIDRSTAVRWLLLQGLADKSWLLRTGKGKGFIGEYIDAIRARVRADGPEALRAFGAEGAFARARPKSRQLTPAAEIKAHRAKMEAADKLSRLGDRVALQNANRRRQAEAHQKPPPTHKPAGRARRLGEAEVKAAVDRAMARRKEPDA
jgi:hypothetical protein